MGSMALHSLDNLWGNHWTSVRHPVSLSAVPPWVSNRINPINYNIKLPATLLYRDCPGKCPPGRCPQGKIHSNNKCPRDVVPGEKFTPTSKLWMAKLPRRNSLTTIAAPSGIISPLHHFTIRENTEVKRQNRR